MRKMCANQPPKQAGRPPIVDPRTVLKAIIDYAKSHGGNSPTGGELVGLLIEDDHEISSQHTIYGYLENLEKLGWIEMKDRKIVVTGVQVTFPEIKPF